MALLKGNNMQFTWSLTGEGPQTETRGHQWVLVSRTNMFNTTPEATDTWEEYTEGMSSGVLRARFHIDSGATPLIPAGAIGVAVLYLNKSGGGRSYTCQARCMNMQVVGQSNSGGAPQVVEYTFQVSLNGATAGIVAA